MAVLEFCMVFYINVFKYLNLSDIWFAVLVRKTFLSINFMHQQILNQFSRKYKTISTLYCKIICTVLKIFFTENQ